MCFKWVIPTDPLSQDDLYQRQKNSICTTLFLTNSKIACIRSLRADCFAVLLSQTDPPSIALWSGWISSSQIPSLLVLRGQSCGMQIFSFSVVRGGQDNSPQHRTPWFPMWLALNLQSRRLQKNSAQGLLDDVLLKAFFFLLLAFKQFRGKKASI